MTPMNPVQVRKRELKAKVDEQKEKLRKFQLLQKYKETVNRRSVFDFVCSRS